MIYKVCKDIINTRHLHFKYVLHYYTIKLFYSILCYSRYLLYLRSYVKNALQYCTNIKICYIFKLIINFIETWNFFYENE